MFELIHEFAVLGTACFMMALATVWYSPILFGGLWMRETGITDKMIEEKEPQMLRDMLIAYVSYVGMLGLLALVVVYAPMLGVTVLQAAIVIAIFTALSSIGPALFEGRSLTYYLIRVGFYTVFIIIGTLMLEYWPW